MTNTEESSKASSTASTLSNHPSQPWSVQDYIEQRLTDQQTFHDNKSNQSQTKYKWLRRAEIIAAGLIPVLAIVPGDSFCMKLIIGSVGALVAILASFLALGNYQQDWINHRATSEALKAEEILFVTRCGVYSDPTPSNTANQDMPDALQQQLEQQRLCQLVENVEAILADEHSKWQQHKQKQQGKKATK